MLCMCLTALEASTNIFCYDLKLDVQVFCCTVSALASFETVQSGSRFYQG